jgi:hypothetical protein
VERGIYLHTFDALLTRLELDMDDILYFFERERELKMYVIFAELAHGESWLLKVKLGMSERDIGRILY